MGNRKAFVDLFDKLQKCATEDEEGNACWLSLIKDQPTDGDWDTVIGKKLESIEIGYLLQYHYYHQRHSGSRE